MSDGKWTEEILRQLSIRDAFERKDSHYYSAFSDLVSKFQQAARSNYNDDTTIKAENVRLHHEIDKVVASLNHSAIEIEKLQEEQRNNENSIRSLKTTIDKGNLKVSNLLLEVQEKNKTVEIVNDELLVLQMQVNLLNEKVDQLTAENENLIQRWMDKVSEDAEKLNDANQFLESIHK